MSCNKSARINVHLNTFTPTDTFLSKKNVWLNIFQNT